MKRTKEIELTIPTKLEEITVEQYSKYFTLAKGMEQQEELNEFVRINVVSIFCDVPIDFVRDRMIYQDVIEISNKIIGMVIKLDKKIISDGEPKPIVTVSGTEFGFIPNFDKMSAGEFADLSSYIKDMDTLNKVVAVLYRPITEKKQNKALGIDQYKIRKYEGTMEYGNLMKKFPAQYALSAYFFVYSSYLILTSPSLVSTVDKRKK